MERPTAYRDTGARTVTARENHWNILQFDSKKRNYVGYYNLSRINQYHQSFKDFLRPFKGIVSKFVTNYINWHNYLNRCDSDFVANIITAVNDMRSYRVSMCPPIPFKTKYDKFFITKGCFSLSKQVKDENSIKNR